MTKPKICDITGTEVGEVFTVRNAADGDTYAAYVTVRGMIAYAETHALIGDANLCAIINDKATIERKPRFSQDELGTLRLLYDGGMRWLTRDEQFRDVPNLQGFSGNVMRHGGGWIGDKPRCVMPAFFFPQVQWADTEPLDIAATLRAARMEVEE